MFYLLALAVVNAVSGVHRGVWTHWMSGGMCALYASLLGHTQLSFSLVPIACATTLTMCAWLVGLSGPAKQTRKQRSQNGKRRVAYHGYQPAHG